MGMTEKLNGLVDCGVQELWLTESQLSALQAEAFASPDGVDAAVWVPDVEAVPAMLAGEAPRRAVGAFRGVTVFLDDIAA